MRGVQFLTLFAFSSENWRRPADEVSFLMRLFTTALRRAVVKMHANNIRLRVVGDDSAPTLAKVAPATEEVANCGKRPKTQRTGRAATDAGPHSRWVGAAQGRLRRRC